MKKKYIILLTIVMVLGLYMFSKLSIDPEQKFSQLNYKAHQAVATGNLFDAIKYWEKALDYKQDDLDTLYRLSSSLYDINTKESEKYLKQLIKYHGNKKNRYVAIAYEKFGGILKIEGNVDEARSYFNKSIKADQSYGLAYDQLALTYDGDQRVQLHRKGIEMDPDELQNYLHLLYYYDFYGQLKNLTATDLYTLIPLDRASGTTLSYVGNFFTGVSPNYDLAILIHQNAIKIDDSLALSYQDLGNIYFKRRMYSVAEEYYKKAIQLEKDIVSYRNLALLYSRLGDYKKAVEILEEYQEYDSIDYFNTEYILSKAYYEIGDYKKALYWINQYGLKDAEAVDLNKLILQNINH